MPEISLRQLAQINPRTDLPSYITNDSEVSFIGMADVSESGEWTSRQARRVQDVRTGFTAFRDSDVLLAKITPCLENGKGAHAVDLVNNIGFGSTEFHVLRAHEGVSSRYLHHLCQSRRLRLSAETFMIGSAGQQRVQMEFFDRFHAPQLPLPEQECIADILDTLDIQIRQTEEVIAKLQQIKQGLLTDLLTRGIDENGEMRPPPEEAPLLYKDSPLGRIPRAWEYDILGNVTEWFSGGTPNRAGSRTWQGSIPFLTPKDMKRLTMEDTSEHVTMEAAQNASRLMDPGTVFLVVRGMILAHTFPVCINEKPFAFNQDIKAVRATEKIRNRYLGHWFAANTARFLAKATASTHGTKKLDSIELHRTAIAFPPLTEQDLIIRQLAQIDEAITKEKTARDKLLAQKPGLMEDLLTGQVRVTPLLDEAAEAAG